MDVPIMKSEVIEPICPAVQGVLGIGLYVTFREGAPAVDDCDGARL